MNLNPPDDEYEVVDEVIVEDVTDKETETYMARNEDLPLLIFLANCNTQ